MEHFYIDAASEDEGAPLSGIICAPSRAKALEMAARHEAFAGRIVTELTPLDPQLPAVLAGASISEPGIYAIG
jgi:hypothetical protein